MIVTDVSACRLLSDNRKWWQSEPHLYTISKTISKTKKTPTVTLLTTDITLSHTHRSVDYLLFLQERIQDIILRRDSSVPMVNDGSTVGCTNHLACRTLNPLPILATCASPRPFAPTPYLSLLLPSCCPVSHHRGSALGLRIITSTARALQHL